MKLTIKTDNPSLTQDINEIMAKHESDFTLDTSYSSQTETEVANDDVKVKVAQVVFYKYSISPLSKIKFWNKHVLSGPSGDNHQSNDSALSINDISILRELNEKEDLEISKLDKMLQSHIDNFLAETADFV